MVDAKLIEQFNTVDVKALERKDLGPFNFTDAIELLRTYFDFFAFLVDSTNPPLPDHSYKQIENHLRNFLRVTDQIKTFDPNSPNPGQARTNLRQEIANHWQSAFNDLNSIYTYVAFKKSYVESIKQKLGDTQSELEKVIAETTKSNTNAKELLNQLKTDSEHTANQVEKILDDARKFSADKVVTKYGKIFEDQAENDHKPKIAFWWKAVLCSIAGEIILAFAMIWMYFKYFTRVDSATSISIALVKLFILSAGALVVVQCVKNLNAHNHLYALNKFRANALASFEAFMNSTKDEQVKDALLIQIAKAIYDPNISGYLSKDDSSQHFNHVEIIKQMVDGK